MRQGSAPTRRCSRRPCVYSRYSLGVEVTYSSHMILDPVITGERVLNIGLWSGHLPRQCAYSLLVVGVMR